MKASASGFDVERANRARENYDEGDDDQGRIVNQRQVKLRKDRWCARCGSSMFAAPSTLVLVTVLVDSDDEATPFGAELTSTQTPSDAKSWSNTG